MTASATLFVVDPDETVITMVREIAKEMRIGCESFARAEVFLAEKNLSEE